MKVSVITSVYNCKSFIRDSLESIINQDFDDYEVIVVNDGSDDGTRDILLEYANQNRIRLLENEYNEGISVSRNRALLKAQGEYIAIHDGDDISLPWRLRDESEILDNKPKIGFLGGHAIKISHQGHEIGCMGYPPSTTSRAFTYISRFKLNPIIDPSSMFRKKLILDHGGYDMTMPHSMDFDLWCRLLTSCVLMTNVMRPVIKYRVHDNNISKTRHSEMRKLTDEICAKFKRRSFQDPVLRRSYFELDCFTEYMNIKPGEKK